MTCICWVNAWEIQANQVYVETCTSCFLIDSMYQILKKYVKIPSIPLYDDFLDSLVLTHSREGQPSYYMKLINIHDV